MDSQVEVVAVLGPGGATVLHTMRAHGALAVRQTGPAQVHLVGTAAGPLGGDVVTVRLRVGAGATLSVRSAAATIALPGRDGGVGRLLLGIQVEDGGLLDCALEPLVVCAGAQVRAQTRVSLEGSGQVHLLDQVVLGRHGEPGGQWTGRTAVDRDRRPVLRQSTDSGLVAAAGSGIRALVGLLDSGFGAAAATSGNAVACPLAAGGVLVSATGRELGPALADLDAVRRLAAQPVPTG